MENVVQKSSNRVLKEDNMWITFEENGTLLFTEGDNVEKRGTWAYDADLKILYISERRGKRQDEVRIKKLTKKKLVLDVVDQATVYLKRVD